MKITIQNYTKLSVVKIISILAGIGFFAKQFYVSRSGTMQIGDIFLVLSMGLSILTFHIRLQKNDGFFAAFILFCVVINGLYYWIYSGTRFIMSMLYMLFNGMLVLFLFRPMITNDTFLQTLKNAFRLVLVSQIVFYIMGSGTWLYNRTRYIGTFNDPNQFAFYILTCFFCLYIISEIQRKKLNLFWFILPAIEILLSASTGMIIAYFIFIIGFVIGLNSSDGITKNKEIISVLLLFVFAVVVFLSYKPLLILLKSFNIPGFDRIANRLLRNSSVSLGTSFLMDRGLIRIFKKPVYFLYGSGEGGWERFIPISNEGFELHSTVIALAYYYGIIPYAILLKWVRSNIKNIKPSVLFTYISLLLEAFTLINHRQPIFWFIIVLASHKMLKREDFSYKLADT